MVLLVACNCELKGNRTVWEKCCALKVENGFFFVETFCGST